MVRQIITLSICIAVVLCVISFAYVSRCVSERLYTTVIDGDVRYDSSHSIFDPLQAMNGIETVKTINNLLDAIEENSGKEKPDSKTTVFIKVMSSSPIAFPSLMWPLHLLFTIPMVFRYINVSKRKIAKVKSK